MGAEDSLEPSREDRVERTERSAEAVDQVDPLRLIESLHGRSLTWNAMKRLNRDDRKLQRNSTMESGPYCCDSL